MSEEKVILKIDNISKQYRLGLVGAGTLSDDLKRLWYKLKGKNDPFLKIGESNDRSTKGSSKYVWALQNINFEVKEKEVLGIIGKNGAGKSTLLKILSRVTSPTLGEVKTKGRIASLLEVGTGFHPELTGRENIFLNGAILGMTKDEIKSKIDEIVAFSGCERYIETPVKRYSSGMRVRLAFAVAAFLEPDILVIDEVLAVGDAEFQKKAIGKMQDISRGQGRTVLFVSHNMAAVKSLCTRAIVLEHGKVVFEGETNDAISHYMQLGSDDKPMLTKDLSQDAQCHNDLVSVNAISVRANQNEERTLQLDDEVVFKIDLEKKQKYHLDVTLKMKDSKGNYFLTTSSRFNLKDSNTDQLGNLEYQTKLQPFFFSANQFFVDVLIVKNKNSVIMDLKDIFTFQIIDDKKELGSWMGKLNTPLRIKTDWTINAN